MATCLVPCIKKKDCLIGQKWGGGVKLIIINKHFICISTFTASKKHPCNCYNFIPNMYYYNQLLLLSAEASLKTVTLLPIIVLYCTSKSQTELIFLSSLNTEDFR